MSLLELRDALAAMEEFVVTDGWVRRQWDGKLELGRYWRPADRPYAPDWLIVLYSWTLGKTRIRIMRLCFAPIKSKWAARATMRSFCETGGNHR